MTLSYSIKIAAAPERVWAVLFDVLRWPEWTPTVTSLELVTGAPLTIGSRVRIDQPNLPIAEWRVTELVSPGRLVWEQHAPLTRIVARHLVVPESGGSRVTLEVQFAGLIGALAGRITRGLTQRYIRTEALGLKRRSEERRGGEHPG